jgi:hypothetical protein
LPDAELEGQDLGRRQTSSLNGRRKISVKARFDYILDPFEQFVVWDNQSGIPAMFNGRILTAASLQQAQELTAFLNARDRGKETRNSPIPLPPANLRRRC